MKTVSMSPQSTLSTKVIKATPQDLTLDQMRFFGTPNDSLPEFLADWKSDNLPNFMRGFRQVAIALEHNLPHFYGRLWVKHIAASGEVTDYGLVSLRVVTNNGVNYIANCFAGTATYEPELMKYHGIGTGTTAEAAANADLVTAIAGADLVGGARATGTTTLGATSNVYRTVGVNTLTSGATTKSVTEHGIFSAATIGSGTLLDRTVFSAISLAANDSLQTTYDLTFTAGS